MDLEVELLLERVTALHGAAYDDEVVRGAEDKRIIEAALAAELLYRPIPRFLAIPGTDPRIVKCRQFRAHLTCASAAEVLGYPMWNKPESLHLAVPRNHSMRPSTYRDLDTVTLHRKTQITPLTVDDFPVVSPAEIVACCLVCLDELDAICVADAALNRGDTSTEEISELLTGRYAAKGRQRLMLTDPASRSPLETRTRLALRHIGLAVETGVTIEGVGEVDMLVQNWLIVETDGWEFHSSNEQFTQDRRRDQEALAGGYVAVRLTGQDVAAGEDHIRSVVARAFLGVAHSSRLALPENPGIMRNLRKAAQA
ncbi:MULTISPECIES: hypothetical protein [Actinomyces]|uniref:DUF559 domain-containing protein n=1 Tax=Actinomyces glycerinitolerans TaxID=1892869 RepID=A0A1M4RZK4_9ACTO|nr:MULTISPECIES: hypothetical protein [Actinomyces]SHE25372.1 Hypothetical protein ACGLYG10_1588 [Actinomyces glycerinitolerans]